MATDTLGNQRVDYVWGNMPPQPDTGRATALDGSKGFHLMLKNGYNGFPDYTPVAPYLDEIANATVPNVVGLSESAANTALVAAGLIKGAVTTADNAAGATSGNDGQVKTQTPASGTVVNTGASVALVKYAYTP